LNPRALICQIRNSLDGRIIFRATDASGTMNAIATMYGVDKSVAIIGGATIGGLTGTGTRVVTTSSTGVLGAGIQIERFQIETGLNATLTVVLPSNSEVSINCTAIGYSGTMSSFIANVARRDNGAVNNTTTIIGTLGSNVVATPSVGTTTIQLLQLDGLTTSYIFTLIGTYTSASIA
jgi:hypothetical protein